MQIISRKTRINKTGQRQTRRVNYSINLAKPKPQAAKTTRENLSKDRPPRRTLKSHFFARNSAKAALLPASKSRWPRRRRHPLSLFREIKGRRARKFSPHNKSSCNKEGAGSQDAAKNKHATAYAFFVPRATYALLPILSRRPSRQRSYHFNRPGGV